MGNISDFLGGGGGVPVNGVLPLRLSEIKPKLSDGSVMLRSGYFETNLTSYPDAIASDILTASFLQDFSVANEDAYQRGLFFKPDGLKMYVTGSGNDKVYEYDTAPAIGIHRATDADTGLPIYVRIK